MKINTAKKTEIAIGIICFVLGIVVMMLVSRQQIQTQKKLTARILSNAVQSMNASQKLANSCSNAYNTATTCVANIKSCNIEEQTKKLDEFNAQRIQADQQINLANKDIQNIIEEVSTNR